jgi:hypothetical protein
MTYVHSRDSMSTTGGLTRTATSEVQRANEPAPLQTVLPLLVAYGALAPSPYNTQPWQFRTTPTALEIRLDHGCGTPLGGPPHRELVIGCGAALFNTRVALRHFGYHDVVSVCPDRSDDRTLARIQGDRPTRESASNRTLFHAIPHRHTLRARGHLFEPRPVPSHVVDELSSAARACGAWVHVVTAAAERFALADLVFEAGEDFATPAGMLGSEDGLDAPIDVAGTADDSDRTAHAFAVAEARRASRTVLEAPIVLVLGTEDDDPAAWVAAGEGLEHLLLRAATHGVFAAYANQPLRVAALRPWVNASTGETGGAHVLLGLGFAHPPEGPSRRRIAEMLA